MSVGGGSSRSSSATATSRDLHPDAQKIFGMATPFLRQYSAAYGGGAAAPAQQPKPGLSGAFKGSGDMARTGVNEGGPAAMRAAAANGGAPYTAGFSPSQLAGFGQLRDAAQGPVSNILGQQQSALGSVLSGGYTPASAGGGVAWERAKAAPVNNEFNQYIQATRGQEFADRPSNVQGPQQVDFHNFLYNEALSPDSNQYLRATADAAIRPIFQNLNENVLPQLRSQGVQSGTFGGSRGQIAQGLASRGALDAAGDATSRIYSQGYGQALDAGTRAAAADTAARTNVFGQQLGAETARRLAGLNAASQGSLGQIGANTARQNAAMQANTNRFGIATQADTARQNAAMQANTARSNAARTAAVNALGLTPSLAQSQLLPGQITAGIGSAYQNLRQRQLDEQNPMNIARNLLAAAYGHPGGRGNTDSSSRSSSFGFSL